MSTKHWSTLGEAGITSGLRIMLKIYQWFGRSPFQLVLIPVILYFFLFRRSARRASIQYLQRLQVFSSANQFTNLYWTSYRQFYNFGECILDKLAVWQGDIQLTDVQFSYCPTFNQAHVDQRGGLIICSHLGNLDVCRALSLQRPNLKINVLAHTENAQRINALIKELGTDSHVNMINVSGFNPATAMLLSDKLAAGEFIVAAGDRTPIRGASNTCEVNFMGHKAPFPLGPFILAGILKCPVFTLFCVRGESTDTARYHLQLKAFSERIQLPRKNRQKALQQHVQNYADILAEQCIKTPLQWYNFHDFWTTSPPPGKPSSSNTKTER